MAEPTLHSVAFPTLDDAQIRELSRCTAAAPKVYRDGQTLIAVGDRDFKFFIVRSGEIEIIDHSGDAPKTVVIHRKGEFTGDVSHLTGRASSSARWPRATARWTRCRGSPCGRR